MLSNRLIVATWWNLFTLRSLDKVLVSSWTSQGPSQRGVWALRLRGRLREHAAAGPGLLQAH